MDDTSLFIYVFAFIAGIFISYFLFRWIFAIDKRVRQNSSIINLLTLIAKKHDATADEIMFATKTDEEIQLIKTRQKKQMKKDIKASAQSND